MGYKTKTSEKRTPNPLTLYNLELHRWDSTTKTSTHLETKMWNVPYQLAKWNKDVLESQSRIGYGSHPSRGFYYKIIRNKVKTKN